LGAKKGRIKPHRQPADRLDPQKESLTKKKPALLTQGFRLFCFHPSASQAGIGLKTKKPGTSYLAFSL